MNATVCSACVTSSILTPTLTPQVLVGWVPENTGRGTLSLIVSCLVTVFLCTWVVIHPRVCQSELRATLHKIALLLKAILAPEFIAVEGLQEWAQCRRMIRDCAAVTGGKFQLVHAFYVSMLAFRYRTPRGDRVIWPNQYTWLLQQKLLTWESQASSDLSLKKIRDMSKADSAAKLITLIQVCWFVAQSIMRTAHALPLSQLESMTLSYIPLFAVSYFFWWRKPKDIMTPTIINLPAMCPEQQHAFESMAVSTKFDHEGTREQLSYWNVWSLTPRVFEKEAEDRALSAMQQAFRAAAIERAATSSPKNGNAATAHESVASERDDQDLEYQRLVLPKELVISHWDPDLYKSKLWPAICIFGASFGALHLISWNAHFPTDIEMWMWRISAFVSILSMVVFMHFKKVVVRWDGLLTILGLLSPALYFLSRIVMMGQVFAALRAEDPAVYETYEVSTYWIHFL